jgi:hypothetical protein
MVFHNTGCRTINNGTASAVFVVDGENPALTVSIPATDSRSFRGTIFPWCNTADDIKFKAFRFSVGGVASFFMFQRGFSTIAWTPFAGNAPSFEQSIALTAGASLVDVNIDSNGVPSAVRA